MDNQNVTNADSHKPNNPLPSDISKSINSVPNEPATAEQFREVKKEMTGFERATLRWAKTAALLSALAAIFICAQWWEMHQGGIDTHTLAEQAKISAGAAKSAAETADGTLKQNKEFADKTLEQMGKQSKAMQDAADATKMLAREAKRSADVANQSVAEVRANFQRDQRPWVFITTTTLSSEPEEGKEITVRIAVLNTGKSPAMNLSNQIIPMIGDGDPPMLLLQAPTTAVSRIVIQPGLGPTEVFFTSPPWVIPKESIGAYIKKTSMLYVEAKVFYSDIFGKQHWTTFCAFHQHGLPLTEWRFCSRGNEVDTEEKDQKPN